MGSDSVPSIVSFVIRFIQEPGGETSGVPRYRGAIRHVQTDQEAAFVSWPEAVEFIQRYVPIEPCDSAPMDSPKTGRGS